MKSNHYYIDFYCFIAFFFISAFKNKNKKIFLIEYKRALVIFSPFFRSHLSHTQKFFFFFSNKRCFLLNFFLLKINKKKNNTPFLYLWINSRTYWAITTLSNENAAFNLTLWLALFVVIRIRVCGCYWIAFNHIEFLLLNWKLIKMNKGLMKKNFVLFD